MISKKPVIASFAMGMWLLLSACGSSQTLDATHTPTLTPTPPPTNTPTATATPTPTSTPTPTFTPIAIVADPPQIESVVRGEKFDDLSSFEFHLDGDYTLSDGLLILEDPLVSGDPWADGSARMTSSYPVKLGNGYLLLFRSKPEASFFIVLGYGPFNDSSYRAFWFEYGERYSLWTGPTQVVSRQLQFHYQPDTWYFLLLRPNVDSVEGRIWEKGYPETATRFSVDTGEGWMGERLDYVVNVAEGTVELDEFQEVTFSE